MSKKDFMGGLESLIGSNKNLATALKNTDELLQKANERSVEAQKAQEKEFEEEMKTIDTRATFIINEYLLNKLKTYAYWERITIKDALKQALEEFFKDKEIKKMP
jgi:hypothetical protein